MEQNAYLKFPTTQIPTTANIIGATIRLFKTGGGGGPALVKLASCAWSRSTLTYTASETLPGATVSEGVTAVFPEESDIWASVMLKPSVVQSARANGDHICLEVSGGPKAEPAILSSELTSKPPQLKIEVQSLPKTEAEKKAIAEKKAAAKAKLAREQAVEDHLRETATAKLTAKALGDKAAILETKIAKIKAEGVKKENAATTGENFKAEQAKFDAEKKATLDTQLAAAATQVKEEEEGKMKAAIEKSGTTGKALEDLKAAEKVQLEQRLPAKLAAKTKEVTDKVTGEFAKKLADVLKAKRAKIAEATAKEVAAETAKASALSDAQKESIKTEAAAEVTKKMADYKAGKLKVKLPDAKAIAGAQGADPQNGLTEKQRAALATKVSDEVAKKLPAVLESKVDAKMVEATNKAIIAVQKELTDESNTKLEADKKAQTAGKTGAERKKVIDELTAAAKTALEAKITKKTSGEALIGLKTKLRVDLAAQLKPVTAAEIKAEVMKTELSKAKLVAAQNNGATELGSALDQAAAFPLA